MSPDPVSSFLAGITYVGSVTTPSGGSGEIAFVQLITSFAYAEKMTPNSIIREVRTTHGSYVLDRGRIDDQPFPQYRPPVPIVGDWTRTITAPDGPAFPMTRMEGQTGAFYNSQFEVYLMYKPSGDSVWVTLQSLEWNLLMGCSWDAKAHRWVVYGIAPQCPQGYESTELPQWSNYMARVPFSPLQTIPRH